MHNIFIRTLTEDSRWIRIEALLDGTNGIPSNCSYLILVGSVSEKNEKWLYIKSYKNASRPNR